MQGWENTSAKSAKPRRGTIKNRANFFKNTETYMHGAVIVPRAWLNFNVQEIKLPNGSLTM